MLTLADGTALEGAWVEDRFEGRGSCTHVDGARYEGMWRNGRKEGRGSLEWPNGATYEGRFKDDKIDGQGALLVPKPVPLAGDAGWLLPIKLKADMARVHVRAGFDEDGL